MMRMIARWLQDTSFRRQLSFSVAIGVVAIALISSLVSAWFAGRQIRTTLVSQGMRVTTTLAGQSKLALLYGSPDNASDAVNTALTFPDVVRVEIYQPNGKALVARGPKPALESPPTFARGLHEAMLESETDDAWYFIAPVLAQRDTSPFETAAPQDEVFGYVRLIQGKATLARMIREVLIANLAIAAAFAALSVSLIRFLAGRLTRPLMALSDAMAQAEQGDFAVRAPAAGSADLVRMGKAFNQMISALEERERALFESQRQYREVFESVKEVIFQTDADGCWMLLNPAWHDITGREAGATLGTQAIDCIAPEHRELFAAWQHRLSHGEVGSCRYAVQLIRADGTLCWIELTQHASFDHEGQYLGTAGTFDDINERRRIERELDDYRLHLEELVAMRTDALQAANKELEAFSYSVSHDLRAPLRRVNGFSHMLEEDFSDRLDDTGREYLRRIRLAVETMDHLIEALLGLAKVSRAPLAPKTLDLSAIAQEMADDLVASEPLRAVDIRIQPDISAEADPGLMRVVMQNLINNAWKYSSKAGRAMIEFGADVQPDRTVYYVRDNGVGFDMAHTSKLFGAFQRLHSDKEFEGTGVGLATVQRIVHRHGGEIWAESAVGNGATFHFTLCHAKSERDQLLQHDVQYGASNGRHG